MTTRFQRQRPIGGRGCHESQPDDAEPAPSHASTFCRAGPSGHDSFGRGRSSAGPPSFERKGLIAESGHAFELVEGNVYFPPESVKREFFQPSATHTICPWKGTASYYTVVVDGKVNVRKDRGTIMIPKPEAASVKDHVAFSGRGFTVTSRSPAALLDTPLTRQLGIEVPLICGAMYPCSNPELVAAVSAAGGIGVLQPLSLVYVHGHEFAAGMALIRRLTAKPVGMNVIVERSS